MMEHVNTNETGIHPLTDAELDKVNGGSDIGTTIKEAANTVLGPVAPPNCWVVPTRPGSYITFCPSPH
jgi:hypothetical protein